MRKSTITMRFKFIDLKTLVGLLSLLLSSNLISQNISINTSGAAPDSSAMLDVVSTQKGMLIPRMIASQKSAISGPATGLMIFQTDDIPGFYFNAGTPAAPSWIKIQSAVDGSSLINDADNDTKVEVEKTANDDIIRFDQAGTEFFRMDSGRLDIVNTNNSIVIGNNSGLELISNAASYQNVVLGNSAMQGVIGRDNVGIGFSSLGKVNSTNARENTAIGMASMENITSGYHNTAIGRASLTNISDGYENTAIGRSALTGNTSGSNNVALGNEAGSSTSGSFNVLIGNQAGSSQTGSNKLYIENSSSSQPLIYGDFANDSVKIYGQLSVGDAYTFPNSAPVSGNLLIHDGTGLVWSSTTPSDGDWVQGTGILYNTTDQFAVGTSTIPSTYLAEFESPASTAYPISLSIDNNYNGPNQTWGISTDISSAGNGQKFGVYNSLNSNASQAASIYGVYNRMNTSNTEDSYGAYIDYSSASGTGDHYGFYTTGEDYNYFSGNVGIGTTSPDSLLDVSGGAEIDRLSIAGIYNFPIDAPSNGDILKYNGNGTNLEWDGSASVWTKLGDYVFNSSDSIGIGTSIPTNQLSIHNASTASHIDVKGVGDSYNFSGIQLASDETLDKSWSLFHRNGATAIAEKNDFFIQYDNGGTSSPRYNDFLTIDTTGLVGIGQLRINNSYTFPTMNGTGTLSNDGSGNLSWGTAAGSWTVNGSNIYQPSGTVSIGNASSNLPLSVFTSGINIYGIEQSNFDVRVQTFIGNQLGAIGTRSNHKFYLYAFANGAAIPDPLVTLSSDTTVAIGNNHTTATSTLDVAGDIETGAADAFYFGDPTTNGSWRIKRDGSDLSFERRESGAWVFKMKINP